MEAAGDSDLVATKLTAPTLPPQLIDRPRLDAVLDAAVADSSVRVVLVSAPAGSGKSTLVAGWQAARDDCAWLQADPADRDPARFWGHLIGALADLIGEDRVLFGSDYPHPEGLADPASYIDELEGQPEERVRKIMGGNLARLMNVEDAVLA